MCLFNVNQSKAQIIPKGVFLAKEFSKEIALYHAKTFTMNEVLGQSPSLVKFEIYPLAAANSGELTTLVYKCESKNKEGLILGFYGLRWNESGVQYQAYAFKNLPLNEANELLDKIENITRENYKYLDEDDDNNNIYFSFGDIKVLVYTTAIGTRLRIYWEGFDSEWEWSTFLKTKKRLVKKLDK